MIKHDNEMINFMIMKTSEPQDPTEELVVITVPVKFTIYLVTTVLSSPGALTRLSLTAHL